MTANYWRPCMTCLGLANSSESSGNSCLLAPDMASVCLHDAAFILALLTERCLFVDFPFYNTHFEQELDFSWANHKKRLMALGHDVTAPENVPERQGYGWGSMAKTWMSEDLKEHYAPHYGVDLYMDLDWSAAYLQSNPHYTVQSP